MESVRITFAGLVLLACACLPAQAQTPNAAVEQPPVLPVPCCQGLAGVSAVVLADAPAEGIAFTLDMAGTLVPVPQGEITTDDHARPDLYRMALLPVRGFRLTDIICVDQATDLRLPADIDFDKQSIAFAPGIGRYVMCTFRLQDMGGGRATARAEPGRFKYESAWALKGPCCGDSGHDIAVAPDGSFFIVGNYGALDLDTDGTIDLRSESGNDTIVLKGRPSGSLAWVRAPKSPAMSFARRSVALDRHGGAYVAGGFGESLLFYSGERIHARGPSDGFLVRYSADGDPLWARAIGGEQNDSLVDVSTDAAGHVYVGGSVRGSVDLDSDGRADGTVTAESGLLVASYNSSGELRWGRIAISGADITGPAIAVTPEGTVHVAGHYKGADVDLDGDGTVDLPPPGGAGAPFIARFDSAGQLTSSFALLGPGNIRVGKLAHAANGDLLASGYAEGPIDLDGDGDVDVPAGAGGKAMPFVARFDSEGALVWVRPLPQAGRLSILQMASSPSHIALGGLYQAVLDLDDDGQPDAPADADGESEGLVVILDNQGSIHQVLTITGPGADQARSVAFSPDGRTVSLTGFVRLTADFDADGVPEGEVRCDHYGDLIWARYVLGP